MRFIVDECTGPSVARWLSQQHHGVISVYDVARGASDESILEKARFEDRIVITNDKDFGELIFRARRTHKGVILLRLEDESSASKIVALERLLERYAAQIENNFVVVTETAIRIGRERGNV